MTKSQVQTMLLSYGLTWEGFAQWMIGETVSSDSNGQSLYFKLDVIKYINDRSKNKASRFLIKS